MSWQVLTGVVESWSDEGLCDIGRRRFHEARGRSVSAEDMIVRGRIDQPRAVFAAQRAPWRLTEILLGSSNDNVYASVVSWADDATAVLRGSPAQQHLVGPNETWGSAVRRMLEPGALEALVPKPWAAEFRVSGDALERDMSVLPDFVSLASDHYEISYDAGLDVLTRWAAIIDGEVAQERALSRLAEMSAGASDTPA